MYCRKCGNKIEDENSAFCEVCGTEIKKVIMKENEDDNLDIKDENNDSNNNHNENISNLFTKNKKTTIIVLICCVIVISLLFIVPFLSTCKYDKCYEKKMSGSDYCFLHTCLKPGCNNKVSYNGNYCYSHTCAFYGYDGKSINFCKNVICDGSLYCSKHTCSKDGCYEKVVGETTYCSEHQVDMRKKLSSSSFGFTLNSAGGIDFRFSASNYSRKGNKICSL